MGLLPITEKGKPVGGHAAWPLFYMNDFSRLGLVVGRMADTLDTLRANGFRVLTGEAGQAVQVDGPGQAQEVFTTLLAAKLDFEVADLVSCAYQG